MGEAEEEKEEKKGRETNVEKAAEGEEAAEAGGGREEEEDESTKGEKSSFCPEMSIRSVEMTRARIKSTSGSNAIKPREGERSAIFDSKCTRL